MRIARIECLSAYAGWRIHDFLNITLANGLAGWSEFSRGFGGPGAIEAIGAIAPALVGKDPRSAEVQTLLQESARRSFVTHQASSAIYNALLDVRARALGVPVYELLGGKVRDRIPVYWAHCGTYRVSHAELMQRPAIRSLDDVAALGREVVDRGFTALKTNLLLFDARGARRYASGVERAPSPALTRALADQLAAFRDGAGNDVDIMVDLGSNFRTDGALRMARAMEPYAPAWLEVELRNAAALRYLRERTTVPIAGGESLRPREYHDLLRTGSVDVTIVDVLFNGLMQSLHIAAAAEAHDVGVAVHNCYSPLATALAATYCAVVPNLRLLECDVDEVPWNSEFVTVRPAINNGYLDVPNGPGWGTEVHADAVRAHPVPAKQTT